MIGRRWSVRGILVALVCAAALAAPTAASASLVWPLNIGEVWGHFDGEFTATSFFADETGGLHVAGNLTGTVYDPLGAVNFTLDHEADIPRPVFSITATCQSLQVGLETAADSIRGQLSFAWGGTLSASTPDKDPALCKVSRLVARGASSAQIAAALNRYLSKNP